MTATLPHYPPLVAPTARLRLPYLDGLRGLAALFVVVHHIHQEVTYRNDLPARFLAATKWLQVGHYAVALFIVLSGYSLMLPVARTTNGGLPGGFNGYLLRRARRIFPPYFAALAFTFALILLVPDLRRPTGWAWDISLPNLARGTILSHLFLVHNLSRAWAFTVNGPMWSVATEWQIYFLFPLLLLPAWRKWGVSAALIVGWATGTVLQSASGGRLASAAPWYVGLFAMGMAAADLSISTKSVHVRLRQAMPWRGFALLFTAGLAATIKLRPEWLQLSDPLAGLAAACLLLHLARPDPASGPGSLSRRVLQSRFAMGLGAISYSLYLVHSPSITLVHLALRKSVDPSPSTRAWLLPVLSLPASLAVAYVFYRGFEKPFSSRRRPRQSAANGIETSSLGGMDRIGTE